MQNIDRKIENRYNATMDISQNGHITKEKVLLGKEAREMFQFSRELILPLFLQMRIPITTLAKAAGISSKTAERAINGLPVHASIVDRIAVALGIENPLEVLVETRGGAYGEREANLR